MLISTLFGVGAVRSAADTEQMRDRTPVGLVLLDNLMSGRSQVGDVVHFETVAPVLDSNNNVLIPAGSFATGRVTRSKGSGMFGKRGELNFTCESVAMPSGNSVHLFGRKIRTAGTNDTAATAAVTVLVSPLGLLIKGGTVKYERGTPIRMYLGDSDNLTPADPSSPEIRADFSLQDKKASDIIGKVKSFDGDTYVVRTDGADQQVSLNDISSISIDGTVAER